MIILFQLKTASLTMKKSISTLMGKHEAVGEEGEKKQQSY